MQGFALADGRAGELRAPVSASMPAAEKRTVAERKLEGLTCVQNRHRADPAS